MLRFYATDAPHWWPFQLASLARWRLPRRPPRPGYYSILVDNGMFTFYQEGRRPEPDKWLSLLRKFIHDIQRRRAPHEVLVILPDWLSDPLFTVKVASSPEARRLCGEVRCVAVAHSDHALLGYARTAEMLAAIDHVYMLAAPLKLNCSRRGRNRLVTNAICQVEVARQVCSAARRHGLPCHGLGAILSPRHLQSLYSYGVTSIDSTSWTRPATTELRKLYPHSAKTVNEREAFFTTLIKYLAKTVPIELTHVKNLNLE